MMQIMDITSGHRYTAAIVAWDIRQSLVFLSRYV
jgi:hypothetical protein